MLSDKLTSSDASGAGRSCRFVNRVQKGKDHSESWGQAPIPPLLGHRNGAVREESAYSRQRTRKHVLSGKQTANGVCENDGVAAPAIGYGKVKGYSEHGAKPHTPLLLQWGSVGRKRVRWAHDGRAFAL